MTKWDTEELGTLATFMKRGFSPKYVNQDGVTIINQRCIREGRIDLSLSKLTDRSKRITTGKLLQKGDILINSTGVGTAGRVAYWNNFQTSATVDTHVTILRVDEALVDPHFLAYYLGGREEQIEQLAEGSTGQVELRSDRLGTMIVPMPTLKDQKNIVNTLSLLDTKIDLLRQQNETLEAMGAAVFREWFVEGDWPAGELGEFVVNQRVNVKAEDVTNEDIYVGLEHLEKMHIGIYHTGSGSDITSNKSAFDSNSILFGKLRPYFHKVGVPHFAGVCSTDILVLESKSPVAHSFCLFCVNDPRFIDYCTQGSGGTRMPRVNFKVMQTYKVPQPPEEAISKFDALFKPLLEKIHHNINQIDHLKSLRDLLLPKLMSGEVTITP